MPSFLTSIISGGWMYLIVALGAAAASGWAVHAIDNGTIQSLKAEDAEASAKAEKLAREDQAARDAITAAHDQIAAVKQLALEANTRTIIQKVPVYVSQKADAACVLPNGFIKLLDAAGLHTQPEQLPNAANEPDDAPSGISLSQASALLATNLGDGAENNEQLKDAESWASEQKAKDK